MNSRQMTYTPTELREEVIDIFENEISDELEPEEKKLLCSFHNFHRFHVALQRQVNVHRSSLSVEFESWWDKLSNDLAEATTSRFGYKSSWCVRPWTEFAKNLKDWRNLK